jgi:hypothetical protein
MGHVKMTTDIDAGDMKVEGDPYFRILFINLSEERGENKENLTQEKSSGRKIIRRFRCSAL